MKRGINIRIGGGRTLGESCESQTLGDSGSPETVVLLRFVSESEESEQGERAIDGKPSVRLKPSDKSWILVYRDSGDLEDAGVSPVGVSP